MGEIKLVAVDPVYVDDMQVYPDIKNKSIKVKMTVRNCTEHTASGKISFHVTGKDYRLQKEVPVTVTDSITYIEEEMFWVRISICGMSSIPIFIRWTVS